MTIPTEMTGCSRYARGADTCRGKSQKEKSAYALLSVFVIGQVPCVHSSISLRLRSAIVFSPSFIVFSALSRMLNASERA